MGGEGGMGPENCYLEHDYLQRPVMRLRDAEVRRGFLWRKATRLVSCTNKMYQETNFVCIAQIKDVVGLTTNHFPGFYLPFFLFSIKTYTYRNRFRYKYSHCLNKYTPYP